MFELILATVGGLIAGGTIVHIFGAQIDADVAKVVAAYNNELAAIKAKHTAAAVKAVAPTTAPPAGNPA